jgi:hypothetical protein
VEGIADGIQNIISDHARQESMSAASRDVISRWSFAECETGLRQAIATT